MEHIYLSAQLLRPLRIKQRIRRNRRNEAHFLGRLKEKR
jgi:hypothetical protein